MGITSKTIWIIAGGLLFLLLGIFTQNAITAFLIYNIACIGAVVLDYKLSDDGENLEIVRLGEDILSIYEKETMTFQITNTGLRPFEIKMKDEIPDFHFKPLVPVMEGRIGANERVELSYTVEPVKRGVYTFGAVYIRYKGKFGLCTRDRIIDLKKEYKVYPNLKNLRKYRLALCNNRMYKDARRNMRSLGRGTAFESLRDYVYGDEYRKINWSASAREDRPIVNQYEPEKNQHVHMLIDTGRAMSYTIRGWRKLDLVVNTVVVLSDIVNQGGDLSGLMLFNQEVEAFVKPGKGVEHRNNMLEALFHIDHTTRTSNYNEAFKTLKMKERHRSIVFLFTDFDTVEDADFILRVAPLITRSHVLVIILIKNESVEAVAESTAKGNDDVLEKGVALELIDERKMIIHKLNRMGVLCVECPPEELEFTAINRYMEIKNKQYM